MIMKLENKPMDSENIEIEKSSERTFGIIFSVFFCIVGLFPVMSGGSISWWAFPLAVFFLIAAFLFPKFLAPLNFIWMKFGSLLHKIVSPIILTIIYFLAVVPVGLIMKLLGKDILNLKMDKSRKSYWIDRSKENSKKESLRRQY